MILQFITINCIDNELNQLKILKQQLEEQLIKTQNFPYNNYKPSSFLQQEINQEKNDIQVDKVLQTEQKEQEKQQQEQLIQNDQILLQNSQNTQKTNLELTQPLAQKYLQDFKQKKLTVPQCTKKEGVMKVREYDQKSKDVPISYAFLTNDRLSYFIDQKDESSIQGSVLLKNILTPIQVVENFTSCFEIKTISNYESYVICVENENTARSWILAITQNVINCN